ncbi:uncharacterized protein LOC113758645 [Coffea eugenioides]|uniref:uncharacterized protein LOC113755355 n=1 Tax=Coffea eugenioides TaxID=49369 RepID=UPI000F610B09|nr:uncharacterized protein LOC113755355 [Coffea eugenioides]XP_027157213.1 uncharacterized protein LOC113758645 [Coffea eugenioides]
MVWLGSPSGHFTVKDGWEALRQRRNLSLVDRFVWNRILPLKISVLVWKVLRNLVLVEVNLQRRGITMASQCSCCSLQEESSKHFFLGGPVVEQVWDFFHGRFSILGTNSQSVSARNKARFEGARLDPQGMIWAVGSMVEQLGRAKVFSIAHFKGDSEDPWARLATWKPQVTRRLVTSWLPPPKGVVKLNTDASVTRGKGLLFCNRVWVQQLLVEVDSAGLVQLLDSGALAKWLLCNSLRQIRALLQSFNATARHIFREANAAVDKLAMMDL